MAPLSSRHLPPALLVFSILTLLPLAVPADSPVLRLEVEGATGPDRGILPGVHPRAGETEAELNRRLLESFGPHPYGVPESPESLARREAAEARRIQESREALLFRLEARALKRAAESPEADIPALIPSRRFVGLSRTLKNPQLLRDSLESRVQRGELSPYDLLDAEQGLFDPTRNEIGYDPDFAGFSGGRTSGRPLPSPSIVRDLLDYQTYIRAERFARLRR
jgi:hypothetical protein